MGKAGKGLRKITADVIRQCWRPTGRSGFRLVMAVLLYPLSLVYRATLSLRKMLYDAGLKKRTSLPGTTISVGNITVGGTGKSPLVIAICRELIDSGFRPAIVTRGYGSGLRSNDHMVLKDKRVISGVATGTPDEAMMQSAALPGTPVIVGAKRLHAVERFIASNEDEKPTHYVLDDGFQHWGIKRDLDIVVVDEIAPLGNRRLLPAGPLREPEQALGRADLIVCRRGLISPRSPLPELAENNFSFEHGGPEVVTVTYKPSTIVAAPHWTKSVSENWRESAVLVAGIARPDRLIQELNLAGVVIVDSILAADHQRFDRELVREKSSQASALVVTPKDYWREPDIFASLSCVTMIADVEVDLDPVRRLNLWKKLLAAGTSEPCGR